MRCVSAFFVFEAITASVSFLLPAGSGDRCSAFERPPPADVAATHTIASEWEDTRRHPRVNENVLHN